MEVWGQSYSDIMGIPSTRRVRLIEQKIALENRRKNR